MRTVLIPIDFTRSSNNAIAYAVAMSQDFPVKHIILVVNVYVTAFEQLIPTADFIQFTADKVQAMDKQLVAQFDDLKTSILKKLKPDVRVSFILSKISLLASLRGLIENEKPDLVLLGSDHAGLTEESFISDHLIKIAKTSTVPVLIIPSQARYQKINNALVPFNLGNFTCLNLLNGLKHLNKWPHPKLLFLNVDTTPDEIIREELSANALCKISDQLSQYQHQFFYSAEKDVLKSINHFSYGNEIQLIIALPGKHSFLYSLTHRSITKALARNNYKPVLILKAVNN
jgi:nucleotide-binding universal stress UspA family protein